MRAKSFRVTARFPEKPMGKSPANLEGHEKSGEEVDSSDEAFVAFAIGRPRFHSPSVSGFSLSVSRVAFRLLDGKAGHGWF